MNTNETIDALVKVLLSREQRRGTDSYGQYAYLSGYLQSELKGVCARLSKKARKELAEEMASRCLGIAQSE